MVHIIKVFLEDANKEVQIRRLAVSSDIVSSYVLLKQKIKSLFQVSNANLDIKWKDDENDLILLSTDDELAQAVANADNGLLKIYATVGDVKKPEKIQAPPAEPMEDSQDPPSAGAEGVTGVLHPGVKCDGCDGDVFGVRYKCLMCHDFDLCSSCNYKNKHVNHDMIKLVNPTYIPREWGFLGARRLWRSMFRRVPRGFFPFPNAPDESSSSSAEGSPPSAHPKVFEELLTEDFAKNITEKLGSFLQNFSDGCPLFGEGPSKKHKTGGNQATTPEQAAAKENGGESSPNVPMETTEVNGPGAAMPPRAPESPKGLFYSPASLVDQLKTAVKQLDIQEVERTDKDPEMACLEGWTMVQNEENNSAPAATTRSDENIYPVLENRVSESVVVPENTSAPENASAPENTPAPENASAPENQPAHNDWSLGLIESKDPKIVQGVLTMINMGFTNEGGWLEKLLISKGGNIYDVLDALYPSGQRK